MTVPPPVICYHRIGGPLELGITRVARPVFERQMTALAQGGWRTLTLSEFADAVHRPLTTSHAPRRFLLTFDDGYATLADHAYPILADLGFSATTFLVTDYVGQTNVWDARYTWRRLAHLGWPDVERWHARGLDFASHTATHARLTWLDDGRVADELGRSRETLVGRLGAPAGCAVAYPFGARDRRVERLAATAGYALGFGSGTTDPNANGRFNLPRVPVYAWDAGATPCGLRADALGAAGCFVARVANRCALGTSVLLKLSREQGAGSST